MNHPDVPVFFYGGLINPRVQKRVGLAPRRQRRGVVHGFALTFEPWVNLRAAEGERVYGLVMDVTHAMLEETYARLAARYLPWPVTCILADGSSEPVLCYIAPEMPAGPIDADHVEALAEGAEACNFPGDYLRSIRSFLPR